MQKLLQPQVQFGFHRVTYLFLQLSRSQQPEITRTLVRVALTGERLSAALLHTRLNVALDLRLVFPRGGAQIVVAL